MAAIVFVTSFDRSMRSYYSCRIVVKTKTMSLRRFQENRYATRFSRTAPDRRRETLMMLILHVFARIHIVLAYNTRIRLHNRSIFAETTISCFSIPYRISGTPLHVREKGKKKNERNYNYEKNERKKKKSYPISRLDTVIISMSNLCHANI